MGVQNLFGKGERAIESCTNDFKVLAHFLVVDVVSLLPDGHFDPLAEIWSIGDGCEAAAAKLKALLAEGA